MTNYLRAFAEPNQSDTGPIRFVASTEGVKRDGHDLRADDWDLSRYRSNPVILWSHGLLSDIPPIGRAEVSIEDRRLMADVTFDQNDPFARMVEAKYRSGFMSGVSVNWDTDRTTKKNELIEISAVPIPLDADALIQRTQRGYAEIGKALTSLIDDDQKQTVTQDEEALWIGTAYQMVRLFRRDANDAESVRLQTYKRLARGYERIGKTAPEFLGAAELAALSDDTWRGLFLEGEDAAVPELFVPTPEAPAEDWWKQNV